MTKKIENLKEMKPEELKKKLAVLREDIRVIHFKAEGSKSKNVKEAKSLRKQVAQILTEVNKNNKKK
jgi:ribosomal protein L29